MAFCQPSYFLLYFHDVTEFFHSVFILSPTLGLLIRWSLVRFQHGPPASLARSQGPLLLRLPLHLSGLVLIAIPASVLLFLLVLPTLL